LLDHVGYIPWLREKREQVGLSEDELEFLLTQFPDHFLACYFRNHYDYGNALMKAGMQPDHFQMLWRRGSLAALLRCEHPSSEINELADILAELTGSNEKE
jgi:hypothetical protein